MRKDQVFPSKYFKAADLHGDPLALTITAAPYETLTTPDGREESKVVLYFRGTKKCLPLNLTNFDAVADATGEDDTDRWPGCQIELYPTTTDMRGKIVPCIRIRPPAQPALSAGTAAARPPRKPPAQSEMDDEIPF